jgi:protocatechuate 3,4-dioxygenase, beta subunit
MIAFLLACLLLFAGCQEAVNTDGRRADRYVGGQCEGCEAALEYGAKNLLSVDTIPGAGVDAPLLAISGTVLRPDRATPAANVIIYIHHTDQEGRYQIRESNGALDPDLQTRKTGPWANRHGTLRGWVRTGDDGRYKFLTQRPAPYPGRNDPAHIHMYVKEPGLVAYYIDDILFTDDTLLTDEWIASLQKRGGSGVVTPVWNGDHWEVSRDIILGMNIPDH